MVEEKKESLGPPSAPKLKKRHIDGTLISKVKKFKAGKHAAASAS